MEFIDALDEIIRKKGLSFWDVDADKTILIAYESYCENENDLLQFQEYKNILSCNVLLANDIFNSYYECKTKKDKHFKALADKIEEIADKLEKHNISCFSYSYFIYAFLRYFIRHFNDDELNALKIEPVRWLRAEDFDLSGNYNVTDEETFGFGRYKETKKSFELDGKTLKKYKGKSTYVIVPNFVDRIGKGAFSNNKNLRSIYIPNSVTTLDENAFLNCENLETVVLGDKIISIPFGCFEGCRRLKRINLQNIQDVGARGFKGCVSLHNVDFKALTSVGDESFAYCLHIANYDFISNLRSIGNESFRECTMDYVTLKQCETLGENAFIKCKSIARITIEKDIKSLGTTPFKNCNNINFVRVESSMKQRTHLLFCEDIDEFNSVMRSLVCVKKNVINDFEFSGYQNVTNIEILGGDKIPESAFKDCINLESVICTSHITSIGESAFENCSSLANLDMNYLGTNVPAKAFYKCQSLTKFDFLNDCLSFGEKSMAYDDLTSFSFNREFVYIGSFAFANCKFPLSVSLNLEHAKVFPGAFHGIGEVKTLKISSLKDIYGHQLYILFDKSKSEFNSNCSVRNIFIKDTIEKCSFKDYENIGCVEFNIDESDGNIPSEAFKNSSVESIKINGKVRSIDASAFEGCNKLATLQMSYDSLKVMDFAFTRCRSAGSLICLNKVSYFGDHSFEDTDLKSVLLNSNTKHIGKGAFSKCNQLVNVTLPFVGECQMPQSDDGFYFGYIFSDSFGKDDNLQNVHDGENVFEFYIPQSIKEVTVLSERIFKNAFKACYFIKRINLPNIKVLLDDSFDGCDNLEMLALGPALDSFSGLSVRNCHVLESITIDEQCFKYKSLGGNVFSKDGKTIYYLNKTSDLNDYIDVIDEIESWAISTSPDRLHLSGDIRLHEFAIDGSNIGELVLDNVYNCDEQAIVNCSNLKSLKLSNHNTCKLISINEPTKDLVEVSIDNFSNESIVSVFSDDICLNIQNLKVRNSILNDKTFLNILSIHCFKCDMVLDKSAKNVLRDIDVCNMEVQSIQIPISELFQQFRKCESIKNIQIEAGDIVPFAFSNCTLETIELGSIDSIMGSAFAESVINRVNVHSVHNIETNAFIDSCINKFTINESTKYQIKESILYSKDELIYCFDKSMNTLTIPRFVKNVLGGSIIGMNKLKEIIINHPDIYFEKKSILQCPKLSKLVICTIKNETIREIFGSVSSITSITFYGSIIKNKYFSCLRSLRKFIAKDTITNIGDLAFAEDISLESINLDYVNYIGDLAFYNCLSISNVKVNNACKYIGLCAFEGCGLENIEFTIDRHQIENEYTVVDILGEDNSAPIIDVNAQEIGASYFEYYKGEVNVLNSPKTVGTRAFRSVDVNVNLSKTVYIGDNVFENTNLSSLNIDNIRAIGNNAFENCKKLTQIRLGKNIDTIGKDWVKNCPISILEINGVNKHYKTIDNCLVDSRDGNKLIYVAKDNKKKSLTLDRSIVEWIPSDAFNDCLVEELSINGIRKVEKNAFVNCSNLHKMNLQNIGEIDGSILSDKGLIELSIDQIDINGSTKLSSLFDNDCIPFTLRKVTITENIKADNFDKPSNIDTIRLPENLEYIPERYFANCSKLSYFKFPQKSSAIGDEAFKGCCLNSLNLLNIVSFGKDAFYGCDRLTIVELPFVGKSIMEPTRLDYLFNHASNLRYVSVKEGTIVERCFEGFDSIEKIDLQKGVTEIGVKAFKELSNLCELSGMNYLTKIDDNAFENCKLLKEINIKPNIEHIGKRIFKGCCSIEKATLPFCDEIGTLEDYGLTGVSLRYLNINAGDIQQNSFATCTIESVELNKEIKEIPPHTFECYAKLGTVIMPSVIKIGDCAFAKCVGLSSIDLSRVEEIGQYAFYGAFLEANASLAIDLSSLKVAKEYAFAYSRIKSCKLGELNALSKCMFYNCTILENIDLKQIKSYGESVFENCSSLKSIELNDSVKVISSRMFYGATSLCDINIPNELCEIGDYAFAHTNLKNVELKMPRSLTKVGEYIFYEAYSPIVYIHKKQDKNWNCHWSSKCKRHGLFWLDNTVKTKFYKGA